MDDHLGPMTAGLHPESFGRAKAVARQTPMGPQSTDLASGPPALPRPPMISEPDRSVADLLAEMPGGYDPERDEGLLELRLHIGAHANPRHKNRGPARWFRQRPADWGPAA